MNASLPALRPPNATPPTPDARRGLLITALLLAATTAAAAFIATSPALTSALQLDRTAIVAGEWWRLFTGHLTHWNGDHLLWDAVTFLALSLVCARHSSRQTLTCLAFAAPVISLAVLAVHPDLETYRGLSGLDSALFALLTGQLYWKSRRTGDRALGAVAKWALGAFLAKTAYEVVTGETLFVDSAAAAFIPLASAHAAGALVGLSMAASAALQRAKPSSAYLPSRLRSQHLQHCPAHNAALPPARVARRKEMRGAPGTRQRAARR